MDFKNYLPDATMYGGNRYDVLVSDHAPRDRATYQGSMMIVHPRTYLQLMLELDPLLNYAQQCLGHELIRMWERRYGCLPTRETLMRRVQAVRTRPTGPSVITTIPSTRYR